MLALRPDFGCYKLDWSNFFNEFSRHEALVQLALAPSEIRDALPPGTYHELCWGTPICFAGGVEADFWSAEGGNRGTRPPQPSPV